MMKKTLVSIFLMLLLTSTLYLPKTFAQASPPWTLNTGHRGAITSVAFSPDGNTIASGSHDNTIRLWDANTGSQKLKLTKHWDDVNNVTFSPDGNTIASGSDDDTIRLWDANTGAQKLTLQGHGGNVYSVAFSPDGNTIASGDQNDNVILWDVKTGTQKQLFTGHTHNVSSVAFSPDGNHHRKCKYRRYNPTLGCQHRRTQADTQGT